MMNSRPAHNGNDPAIAVTSPRKNRKILWAFGVPSRRWWNWKVA
jgi:hypothetical protein